MTYVALSLGAQEPHPDELEDEEDGAVFVLARPNACENERAYYTRLRGNRISIFIEEERRKHTSTSSRYAPCEGRASASPLSRVG